MIHGKQFTALIDTGSNITLIGNEVSEFLLKHGAFVERINTKVYMANGEHENVSLQYFFHCVINNKQEYLKALYVPFLETPILLGIDVISSLQLVNIIPSLIPSDQVHNTIPPKSTVNMIAELSAQERNTLEIFLEEELRQFENVTGRTTLMEHIISVKPGVMPIKQRYYPRNPAMQEIINKEVENMLAEDIIEPSFSEWSSPVVLVKKPSGKYRFCVDYRQVNANSKKDAYPLPHISGILDKLREAKYISTIDLKNGYWQVPLEEGSRAVTAFTIPGRGLYQFKVLPFGVTSGPACFQRLLDRVIGPDLEPHAFILMIS